MQLQTETELFARLAELRWHPDSVEEIRAVAAGSDLLTMRGRHRIESFIVKPGTRISQAVGMIRNRKGNSRLRFYVTSRANNRM